MSGVLESAGTGSGSTPSIAEPPAPNVGAGGAKFLDPASSTLDARTVSVPFAASPAPPDLIPGFSVARHPLTWGLTISLLVLIMALALFLNAERLSRPLVTT